MDNPSVKSATRVLEILEHFANSRTPASVGEISTRLGFPQSSTSMLLSSMEASGYLAYDASSRTYLPTVRVMLLGAWMHDELFGEGSIISMMASLYCRPHQSVMIGLRQGLHMRYLISLRSSLPLSSHNPTGRLRPLCVSAIGKILLTDEDERSLRLLARRANATVGDPAHQVEIAPWLNEMSEVRQQGWAECRDYPLKGLGGVAIRLPPVAGHPPLGMALGVTMDRLASERGYLIEQLRRARMQFAGSD